VLDQRPDAVENNGVTTQDSDEDTFGTDYPEGAGFFEKFPIFWNTCKRERKRDPIMTGFLTFGHHIFASSAISIFILCFGAANLSSAIEALAPYWPLVRAMQPEMDAKGMHDAFITALAIDFKDVVLILYFAARNSIWVVQTIIDRAEKYGLSFSWKALFVWMYPTAVPVCDINLTYRAPWGPPRSAR
jgi:hypothetical protein